MKNVDGHKPIAIGARLKKCPQIHTIGFKPNFSDYSPGEQKQFYCSSKIYYPTAFYADLFNAMGKTTFPSYHTYKFAQDKIKQTAIFQMLGLPHPRTKIFYGLQPKKLILKEFNFPFIAKIPRGSANGIGVHLIQTPKDLEQYLSQQGPAYIQEYLPIKRDMRIIVIGRQVALGFWRIAAKDTFKTNLSQGGKISFDPLPAKALDLALLTANKCGWDDVGIDIIQSANRLYLLEGNMKYGTKGFQKAGIDYKGLLVNLILKNYI
ncbi:MAG: RimK family alpha-L-glutamate ligase [Desulfobacteraceae bacterium]|nr:RimK family alpha-L-glutamate ligase [Desulfobacteraceae bacterium]